MSEATIQATVDQVTVEQVENNGVTSFNVEEQPQQQETPVTPTAEVKAPEPVKVGLHETATKIAELMGDLVVRPTDSTGYRILGTKENTDLNWRKGLFYVVNQYSKGFNLEMQAYSVKKGAHLAEFNPKFQPLGNTATEAGDQISYEKFGLACRLRIKLPFAAGMDEMLKKAQAFIKAVEPTVAEVRALLKDEDFIKAPKKVVSKKETPVVAAAPAEAPAAAPVVEAPAATAPVEEVVATDTAAAPVVVEPTKKVTGGKAAKKAGKRK